MTAPTTRAGRVAQVRQWVNDAYVDIGINGDEQSVTIRNHDGQEIAEAIDAYYHPRTLRPVQTELGVVTYHEENPLAPWWLEYAPNAVARFARLSDVVKYTNVASTSVTSGFVNTVLTRLTDDDIERCLPLRKQPWGE